MSETKFTKGPWKVRAEGVLYVTDGNNKIVATVASMLDGIDNDAREAETQHNADLIAAAPALYEALKATLPRVAHVAACASVRPTDEWIDKGSTTFDGCQCDIRTIVAALALVEEAA